MKRTLSFDKQSELGRMDSNTSERTRPNREKTKKIKHCAWPHSRGEKCRNSSVVPPQILFNFGHPREGLIREGCLFTKSNEKNIYV